MGEQAEDPYAKRREQIEQAYRSLPWPNTPQYWQALTSKMANGKPLPLEALVRCWRWWGKRYAKTQQDQLFAIITQRIQQHLLTWAQNLTRQARRTRHTDLANDLVQECLTELFTEMRSSSTFLEENFMYALGYIKQKVAHSVMEREGVWQRKGVQRPKRIPAEQIDSINAPISGAAAPAEAPIPPRALADTIPDAAAEASFANATFFADMPLLLRGLTQEQRDLYMWSIEQQRPQQEIADLLNVTDRTVRTRLTQLYALLRRNWLDIEHDQPSADVVPNSAITHQPESMPGGVQWKDTSHAE